MLLNEFKANMQFTPYINTGTLFDLSTGKYQLGVDGKWYLNGGLGLVTGITGRGQTYKSATAGSLLARALANYDKSESMVYETEFTIPDATRYDDFVPSPISHKIIFYNRADMDLGDFFEQIKKIGELKLKNKKDLMLDTPFLDVETNKPYKAWIPTYVLVDSWSKAGSGKEDEAYSKNRVDDSSMNMVYMQEGGVKTKIMRALPTMAHKYGIRFIMTAHVGNKTDLDPYNKSPKQLQYMKGNDKMKNVGSEFEFLTTTLMQVTGTTVLTSSDKKSGLYPYLDSPTTEVNEISGVMVRCKNNAAGIVNPLVVSQYQGILDAVTDFHFCRKHDDFGLVSSGKVHYSTVFEPDKKFTRTTIREVTNKDQELCRALEIIAQLCYIKNYWPSFIYSVPHLKIDIPKIAEILTTSKSIKVSDILNSTGIWAYGPKAKDSRTYLSVWDILELLNK